MTKNWPRLKNFVILLTPLEIAVKYLCQENADLILAENVITFTLKKLRALNTPNGKIVFQQFEIRILQRHNPEWPI